MSKTEKLAITDDDLTTVTVCVELLGTTKEVILDMRTIDALIKPLDILMLIQDLHSCAYSLKRVSEKLRLINS